MIRLLAVDMDGTCLNPLSAMTDGTIRALREAAARGVIIVPATGRNLLCLPHRLADGTIQKANGPDGEKNRGLFRYVITSNGARVTDIQSKKTMLRSMLKKETALSVLEDCRDMKLGIASHIKNRYLIQGRPFAFMGRVIYGKDAGGVCCVDDMCRIIRNSRYDVEELQIYFLSPKAKEEVKRRLDPRKEISAAYTSIYVEIFSAETSKGHALSMLAEELGINKNEIACIGDGENDLSMFRAAGLKIAMGNAVSELKDAADYVTASNKKDGVAEAVRKWVL